MHDSFTFLKSFFKDKDVASIIPTSAFGVKRICKRIDFSKRLVIVEYGPGTGVISKEILKQMTPDSLLILIEKNEDLSELLKKIEDPRLHVYCDSAENAAAILQECGERNADYVISGIPLSFFTPEDRLQLMAMTCDLLADDGHFLVYQMRDIVEEDLEKHFVKVERDFEPLNVPPLFIFDASK